MRCWKCEQEITEGMSTCVYCGVDQSRPAPTTEAGRAMRTLYDRYGTQEVLTNSAYLVNGLGDLTDGSKKLRNQLKMAMDAGVGRIYFEQLNIGTPSNDFDKRVKVLLTEDAGLSDKATSELMVYFDEMIGWRITTQPQTQSQIPTQQVEKKITGSDEIDRTRRYEDDGTVGVHNSNKCRSDGTDNSDLKDDPHFTKIDYKRLEQLKSIPVPEKDGLTKIFVWIFAFAIFMFVGALIGAFIGERVAGVGAQPTGAVIGAVLGLAIVIWTDPYKRKIELVSTGTGVKVNIPEGEKDYFVIALNGIWIASGIYSGYEVKIDKRPSKVVLAKMTQKGKSSDFKIEHIKEIEIN